jgi:predicted transcriptional regulator
MALEDSGITPVEMDVVQYVSEHQPVTVRQVAEAMSERRGIARTTVLTHMERLRKKRVLSRTEMSGVNHYSVARSAQEVVRGMVADFIDRALGGSVSPLIAYLTERGKLTDAETAQLEKIVAKIEKEERP